MKKAVSLSLCVILFSILLIFPVSAETTEIEYLPDGSYYIIEMERSDISLFSDQKSGSKSATYYNARKTAQFKVTVTGYFEYNGLSYEATDSECTVTIYNLECSIVSTNADYVGNTATAEAIVKSGTNELFKSVTITCDENGNLS